MGTRRRSWLLLSAALAASLVAFLIWPRGGSGPQGAVGGGAPGATQAPAALPPTLAAADPKAPTPDKTPSGTGTPESATVAIEVPWRFRVVADATGAPVPDAEIRDREGAVLGRTDAKGVLALEKATSAQGGYLTVLVRAAGFGLAAPWAERGKEREVRLRAGVEIHGRCLLGNGEEPAAGARVTVCDEAAWALVVDTVTADESGRYRVTGAAAGARVIVHARTSGRMSAEVKATLSAAENEVDVRFADGGIIEGTVCDAHGVPLPSVSVGVVGPDEFLEINGPADVEHAVIGSALAAFSWATSTDERGRYVIEGVPIGSDFVPTARPAPVCIARGESVRFASVGERKRRDILVPESGTLVVRIVGGPAAGGDPEFEVDLDRTRFAGRLGTREAPDTWRFEGLAPGAYDVRVARLGFPFTSAKAEVHSGATAEAVIDFGGTLSVEGRVVTAAGAPVSDANVWWQSPTASTFARTDGSGHFRFDGLDATPGRLHVSGRTDPPSARADLQGLRPGGEPLTVVLQSPAWLRVTVVGADPKSVGALEWWPGFSDDRASSAPEGERALRFRVDLLGAPGHLLLNAPACATEIVDFPALGPGETRDLGVVRFEEGRTVELVVVGPDGRAAPKAKVNGRDTDEKGRFTLPHSTRSPFSVSVEAEGWPPHAFTIPAEAPSPVTLRLGPLGTLEVHVVQRDGRPAQNASIRLSLPEDWVVTDAPDIGTFVRKTGPDGVFSGQVQARAYRVQGRLFANGIRVSPITVVTVAPELTTSVTIRLP